MSDAATFDEQHWHKQMAMQANNRAWDLSVQERTAAEDQELLHAAHAAAYHWAKVGTELHQLRAIMLLAEAHAVLGLGPTAWAYAQQMHQFFTARSETPDWELALAHTIAAHAAKVAGQTTFAETYQKLAETAIESIADPADRAIVMQTYQNLQPSPETK